MTPASVAVTVAVIRAPVPSVTVIRISVVAVVWTVVIDVRIHQVISLLMISLIEIRIVNEDFFRYQYPLIERAEFILIDNGRFMT